MQRFFLLEDDSSTGDWVQRVVDLKQAYYQAKRAEVDQYASACASSEKK
jgi:hypothetical protein